MMQNLRTKTKGIPWCDHEKEIFTQTIVIDNPNYVQGRASFKWKACVKCKIKKLMDYSVEKA